MQVGPISRTDHAVFATARTSVPARETPAAPHAHSVARRDYATFLTHENTNATVEHPTYSDLINARNDARRDAARRATVTPEPTGGALPTNPRPQTRRWVTTEYAPAPRPVATPVRVRAETVTNTGSLIDILL